MSTTYKPVSIDANWFKCVTCRKKVIVGDYYCEEAMRLTRQHKCQEHAEGEIRTLWSR